jgi:hypothetical protein
MVEFFCEFMCYFFCLYDLFTSAELDASISFRTPLKGSALLHGWPQLWNQQDLSSYMALEIILMN